MDVRTQFIDGLGLPDQELRLPAGQYLSGAKLGILLLDNFSRPYMPGDLANLSTLDCPVLHRIVTGSSANLAKHFDPVVGDQLTDAARELQGLGVSAIIGSCGFFGNYQEIVAQELDVPIFLSSLLQLPMILTSIKKAEAVLVLGDVPFLKPHLLQCSGPIDLSRIVMAQPNDLPTVKRYKESGLFNPHRYGLELIDLIDSTIRENGNIGAIIAEYSEFPTYASAVQRSVGLPIFDLYTLVRWVDSSILRLPFNGIVTSASRAG